MQWYIHVLSIYCVCTLCRALCQILEQWFSCIRFAQKTYIYFLTSLLEYNCFTMVCQFLLYNKVNQLYIYIYPHISSLQLLPPTLPIPPLQVVTKHQADLPVLCGCFPLAICFTFGSIYKSVPLSHFVPAYPSPSPCPQVHSLCLRLYSCPAPRFIRTIFSSFSFLLKIVFYPLLLSIL